LYAGPKRRVGDDELRCDTARLGEEAAPLGRVEVSVEMSGEDPVERAVLEGKVERVPRTSCASGNLRRALWSIDGL
jgi:hypothetical protein